MLVSLEVKSRKISVIHHADISYKFQMRWRGYSAAFDSWIDYKELEGV